MSPCKPASPFLGMPARCQWVLAGNSPGPAPPGGGHPPKE